MARILAIDDDEAITDLLSRALVRDGHVVAEMNQPDQDRVLDALRDLAAQDGARFDGAGGPEPDEPASAGPGTGTREHR